MLTEMKEKIDRGLKEHDEFTDWARLNFRKVEYPTQKMVDDALDSETIIRLTAPEQKSDNMLSRVEQLHEYLVTSEAKLATLSS